MKTFAPVLVGIAACIALAFAGCSSVSPPPDSKITSVGDNTYKIVREAGSGFTRDAETLEQEARAEAEKFCTERGRKMKTISVTQHRPMYTLGYASAEIIFMALDPNDPALTAPAAAPVTVVATSTASSEAAGPATAVATATPTDDLYAELLKLDELRKKGILTEKEFKAEKKKLLSRSK